MPAPKGMRIVPFAIGNTDAIHVYSDGQKIWLQLRRDVPTEHDIGRPSFKTALSLTPDQAIAVAGELLTAATKKNLQAAQTSPPPLRKPKANPNLAQTGTSRKPGVIS